MGSNMLLYLGLCVWIFQVLTLHYQIVHNWLTSFILCSCRKAECCSFLKKGICNGIIFKLTLCLDDFLHLS